MSTLVLDTNVVSYLMKASAGKDLLHDVASLAVRLLDSPDEPVQQVGSDVKSRAAGQFAKKRRDGGPGALPATYRPQQNADGAVDAYVEAACGQPRGGVVREQDRARTINGNSQRFYLAAVQRQDSGEHS